MSADKRPASDSSEWADVAPDDASWTHVIDSRGKVWARGKEWPMSIVAGGLRFVRRVTPGGAG